MASSEEPQKHSVDWSILPENVFKFMESRTAENSAAFLLPKIKEMRESNSALKFLDVGSGVGSMSIDFAQLVGEGGHVTALDVNAVVIPRGEALAEKRGVKNISFQTADAHKLPFEDGIFDIVHCHQVSWVVGGADHEANLCCRCSLIILSRGSCSAK